MFLLFSFSCLCVAQDTARGSRPTPSFPCERVEDVDFGNATFESGGTLFAFHHGKAHNWDCPACSKQDGKWDWEAEIEKDATLNPSPGVTVRFLLVHDDHKTGTGWWYHLIGFRCSAVTRDPGQTELVKVLDYTAMTLHIDALTATDVDLSITEHTGQRHHRRYTWDNHERAFVLRR